MTTKGDYFEEKIDMDEVCKNLERSIKESLKPNDIFLVSKADLSEGDNLWPVFRWKCVFSIKNSPEGKIVRINKIEKGINLETYCQQKFNERAGGFYKDHTDPHSFYCTYIHYPYGL